MDFNNKKALYLQIMDNIIIDIINQKYTKGDKIISIRDFAIQYTINPNTVSHAYKELENLNIIVAKRGLGYFVNENLEYLYKLKEEKLNEYISDFITNMENLSYTKAEIIEHIKGYEKC